MTPQNSSNYLTEILAIIGAFSWSYPLIMWINKKFARTELEIITHRSIEIGYTSVGPVINFDCAFSSTKEDAFIKDITIELSHESKQTEQFKWEWFEEKLMEMEVPDAGIVPYKRNQKAVALKVLTNTLVEKKIGFLKPSFTKTYDDNYNQLFEVYQNITNKKIPLDELLKTKDYNNLENLFRNNFSWKIGKYNGLIICSVANRKKKFTRKVEFFLTNSDIRKLEQNIQKAIDLIGLHFEISKSNERTIWSWAYPKEIMEK